MDHINDTFKRYCISNADEFDWIDFHEGSFVSDRRQSWDPTDPD